MITENNNNDLRFDRFNDKEFNFNEKCVFL
jgi:hypothetical protein